MAARKRKAAAPLDVVRKALKAYATHDRALIESVLADDFHFTTPIDNRIDRATYLEICWPSNKHFESFKIVHSATTGNKVFVTYEVVMFKKRMRNTDVHTIRRGQIVEAEVYFGWSVPHEVAPGTHKDPWADPREAARLGSKES